MKKQTTITIIQPEAFIAAEVGPAIKSLIPALRQAAEMDIQLTKARDEAHPDHAVVEADQLFASAVNGDTTAERKLWDHGGRAGYAAKAREVYAVREAARRRAALGNLDLFLSFAEKAKPAVLRAGEKIQEQHRSILSALGEPAFDSEKWRTNIGVIIRELDRIEGLVRDGEGAAGLIGLPGFGFHEIVAGEAK
ncbi:MAG: hypothetical protein FGM15_07070 [Chthoniobacterales bacterium]|nr:hypothetical protein [Chthoniobacterales bacterium]